MMMDMMMMMMVVIMMMMMLLIIVVVVAVAVVCFVFFASHCIAFSDSSIACIMHCSVEFTNGWPCTASNSWIQATMQP